MEKVLKLYTYIDGANDTPFPNEEQQVITSDFRSDYKRMGGVPTISCSIMHPLCLDKLWTDNVYATFNGEKFFIKQVPTSSYDNTDARYKHEFELVSERIILDNVYVYDVVTSDTTNDKPVSNSSKFTFFGTIHEYAERLNRSLEYSGLDYRVVVDEGISSEGKMVSFENQFFSNAIQESYNTYEIPYYYVGKVIHIGFTDNAITKTFKYGQDESLLSIQKQNANYKIVNRVTGVGSADNIPYYYPNDYESKEEVEANGGTWINPQPNLMPSIYRDTLGKERFYKALNDTYISPQTGTYYEFENPFIEGKPKEHIVNFEDIKPSIVGMVNSNGLRIDMFSEFAYDLNDNDETDEEGNYLHPYFFGKLRKFDGEYGFNLFDHAIDEDEMVISMTSGNCGACEFVIGVDEDTQKNPVQVDDSGNLKRDSEGNVIRSGAFQDRQNDTQNYEVWIALKKDINTFGVIMPNATNNYKPSTNDTFVILHIDLPKAYILAAEDKLKEELIKYMAMNNSEKFNFSITFSRIFFAENPDILAQLNENARIQIEYDNELYELYVSSYSYNMSSDKPLPEIKVELSDTLTVTQNALQTAISEVKHDIMSSVGSIDWLQQGLRHFLRKDTNDRTKGKLSSDVGFEVGTFVSGASGAIIQVDKNTGQTVAELDKLYVRMKAYFETLEIINVNSVGGRMILSPAGSVTCIGVEETDDAYRCYFLGEQDGEVIENRFESGDQAYSEMFNAQTGVTNKVSNHYYWRLVTGVSEDVVDYNNKKCHYIELSKTDCDADSDVPKAGDVICHRGSRTDTDRMNFIEFSSVGVNAPYITLFQGVNSYSLTNKEYVSYGYDQSTGRAYMNVYGDMYVGDRNQTSYIRYTQENGLEIKGKLSVGTTLGGKDLQELINSATPEGYQEFVDKVTQDIEGLQNQIDGAIESYFYEYAPTTSNYPAMEWDTDSEKEAHLNDTFTNLADGRSWRWTVANGVYGWTEITDTATTQALALAGQAQDTADGKRRVFVDTPTPPYDKGDLWSRGSDYPLMICVTSKSSGSYAEADWDYADNNAELKSLVETTKGDLNNAIGQANEAIGKLDESLTQAKTDLQGALNELNDAKGDIDSIYGWATKDGEFTDIEKVALDAAVVQSNAAVEYYDTLVKAYADGTISEEEKAKIQGAKASLDAAKKYADETAEAVFAEEIDKHYLTQALRQSPDTSILNGLILSSLIQLRDSDSNVMSGINGLIDASKGDKSIANWWGGIMGDMTDYYTWNGREWVAKSGVTIPSNLPSGLIRMDGTGYLAKGKFWWDEDGKIYADPTALLLSFDASTGNETLASTIVDIRTTIAKFSDMWEVKTDANGTEYLFAKRNIVTQGGLTSYADTTDLDIEGIYDGLPIDGSTIYWDGDVLKAKVAEGGITSITKDMVVEALGFTPYDASNPNGYITSAALNDYQTKITSTNKLAYSLISGTPDLSVYLTTSSASSTYQPKITSSAKLAASLISGLATVATSGSYNDLSNKPTIPTSLKSPYALSWSGYSSGSYDGSAAKSITIPSNTNQLTNGAGFITSSASITGNAATASLIKPISGTYRASTWNPLTSYTKIWGEAFINSAITSDSGDMIFYLRPSVYNSGTTELCVAIDGDFYAQTGTKKVWHEGNFTPSNYLPLSGGTLTGTLRVNNIESSDGNGLLSYLPSNWTGVNNTQWGIGTIANQGVIRSNNTSLLHYRHGSDAYTIWDSGNDGSGSGLDADTLDGLHWGSFMRQFGYITSANNGNALLAGTFRFQEVSGTGLPSGATSYGTMLTVRGGDYDTLWQLYGNYNNDGLFYRRGNLTGIVSNAWKQIAFIDSNVASATKLQTARSIWGQSFDGTGNVNGMLIIEKGAITGASWASDGGQLLIMQGTYASNQYCIGITSNTSGYGEIQAASRGVGSIPLVLQKLGGNVGIGVTNPTYKLSVNGSIYINGNLSSNYYYLNDVETNPYLRLLHSGSYWYVQAYNGYMYLGVTSTKSCRIDSTGNFLSVGGITQYSDIRKKTKLQDVELTLKQVANAPLIEHYYNSDDKKTTHVGSIAQYWAEMNDWFCKLDNEGYYTMEIQNAALASAISIARELVKYESKTDRTIRLLKKRINQLEDEIENLKKGA